jgi:hypothetical protein
LDKTATNKSIAAIWAGRKTLQQQKKIQLQFRLDVINLAEQKSSATVQVSAAVSA